MSDTQLNTLVINELTKAQYDALTPEANQLYMVTDEVPLDSSALLPYRTSANQDIIDATKVDKVTGKGLSTNDYTDADKQKVADAITSHQDISGKENISNKVTNISSSSTDTQYPSAKCVYDIVGNIEATLQAIRGV